MEEFFTKASDFLHSDGAIIIISAVSAAVLIVLVFSGLLRRIFSSMVWAEIFLILLAVLLAAGVLIPQTGTYETVEKLFGKESKVVSAIKTLELANVYSSPGFVILLDILLLATFICGITRLFTFATRKRTGDVTKEELQHSPGYLAIRLSVRAERNPERYVTEALRRIGWGKVKLPSGSRRKGVGGLLMSALWHVSLAALIFGCVVSRFAAFDGEVRLMLGKAQTIPTSRSDTLWNKFKSLRETIVKTAVGAERKKQQKAPPTVTVSLQDIKQRWAETVSLVYPTKGEVTGELRDLECPVCRGLSAGLDVFLNRLKLTLTFGEAGLKTKADEAPTRLLSSEGVLKIATPKGDLYNGVIAINRPLRFKRIYFFEERPAFDVEILAGGRRFVVKERQAFSIPNEGGKFEVARVIDGTVVSKSGEETDTKPIIVLRNLGTKREFVLREGAAGKVGRTTVAARVAGRGCVVRYRYDPGVPILAVASLIILIALIGRIYLPRYHIRYLLEKGADRAVLHVVGSEHGLFANGARLIRGLQKSLVE